MLLERAPEVHKNTMNIEYRETIIHYNNKGGEK